MRKKLFFVCLMLVILGSCSKDSPATKPPVEPVEGKDPVAVDDAVQSNEDTEFVITGVLSNDTLENNATLSSVDSKTSQNGTIEDNRDGTFTYTPPKAFVGEDTFTYTICDTSSPKKCDTATVTITVVDQGTPVINADAVFAVQDTATQILGLLDNDDLIDDSVLKSVTATSATTGSVELKQDGTIWYTAKPGFIGNDSFEYTLCDDDTPNNTCVSATVTVEVKAKIAFNIPVELQSYYDGLSFAEVADFVKSTLANHTSTKHTTLLSYGQRHNYLYDADEDLNNNDNVILMYSGESRYWKEYTSGSNSHPTQTFNTEHIYPQSKLNSDTAVSDLHHLRACDASVNSQRSNYNYVDGSGDFKLINDNSWYPGDDWRGDVARMIFYLNIRYGEEFAKVGELDLFLKWNAEDPVSAFEQQRNKVIFGAQGNRNPFIDNPYLATLIWGGTPAENTWQ